MVGESIRSRLAPVQKGSVLEVKLQGLCVRSQEGYVYSKEDIRALLELPADIGFSIAPANTLKGFVARAEGIDCWSRARGYFVRDALYHLETNGFVGVEGALVGYYAGCEDEQLLLSQNTGFFNTRSGSVAISYDAIKDLNFLRTHL